MPLENNPYSEWLGLDSRLTNPNYFQLLGLDELEEDGSRICAAAERALSLARGHRPGHRAVLWAQLLDEISAAKRCLVDPIKRAAYRQELPQLVCATAEQNLQCTLGGNSANCSPAATAGCQPPPIAHGAVELQFHAEQREPPVVAWRAVPVLESQPSADERRDGKTYPCRHRGRQARGVPAPVVFGMCTGFVMLAVAASVLFVNPPSDESAVDSAAERIATLEQAGPPAESPVAAAGEASSNRLGNSEKDRPLRSQPVSAQPAQNESDTPQEQVESDRLPFAEALLWQMTPAQKDGSDSVAGAISPQAPAAHEPAVSPGGSASQLDELRAALRAAGQAFRNGDLDRTEERLNRAKSLAVADEFRTAAEGLGELADYSRQFRQAIGSSLASLRSGSEIQVGDSHYVSVVETGTKRIVIRVRGVNRSYAVSDLPLGLALALGERSMDRLHPRTRAYKAAYIYSVRSADANALATARSWLAEVQAQLPNARQLVAALDLIQQQ